MTEGFVIFADSKLVKLASVCAASVLRYSTRPLYIIPAVGSFSEGTLIRLRWFENNPMPFESTCLLDADMIVTPSIDEIWSNKVDNDYPMFPIHTNNTTYCPPDVLKKCKCDPTTPYLHFVPSLWNEQCRKFAVKALDVCKDEGILSDEQSANITMWRNGYKNFMEVPYIHPKSIADWSTVNVIHGAKDVQEANIIFSNMP